MTASPVLALPPSLEEADPFVTEPFVVFELPDFLPADYHRGLAASWPEPDAYRYSTHATGSKQYLNNLTPEFRRFVRANPDWAALYEFFSSPATVSQLSGLVRPHLGQRPQREQAPWRLTPPPKRTIAARGKRWLVRRVPLLRRRARRNKAAADTTPVYLGFEFSILYDGARIPPHTDAPGKLLSLMIYFPAADQVELPLGTEFYRAKPGRTTRREWLTGMPDDDETAEFFEDHEVFLQSAFAGRKLVGFVKSDVTWHGLGPVEAGPSGRRALIINYYAR